MDVNVGADSIIDLKCGEKHRLTNHSIWLTSMKELYWWLWRSSGRQKIIEQPEYSIRIWKTMGMW